MGQRGHIPSIQFQYVDKGEYEAEEHLLQKRLEAAVTIVGTHSFHSYSPLIDKTTVLEVKPYSYCPKSTTVKISTHRELLSMAELSGYVICEYNSLWWLVLVMETCDNDEIKVQFLHPSGPSPSFSFPKRQDELIVSRSHILMKVSVNTLTGRVYKIPHKDTLEATRLLHEVCYSST